MTYHSNTESSSSEFKILTRQEKDTLSKQRKRKRSKFKITLSNKTKKLKREHKKKAPEQEKEVSSQLSESSTETFESDQFQILTRNQQSALCHRNKRKHIKAKENKLLAERRRACCESCAYQSLYIRLLEKALHPTYTEQLFGQKTCNLKLQEWIASFPFYTQILQEAGWKMIWNRGRKQEDLWRVDLNDSSFDAMWGPWHSLEWKNTDENRRKVRKAFNNLKKIQQRKECGHQQKLIESYEILKIKCHAFYSWMDEYHRDDELEINQHLDEKDKLEMKHEMYQQLIDDSNDCTCPLCIH